MELPPPLKQISVTTIQGGIRHPRHRKSGNFPHHFGFGPRSEAHCTWQKRCKKKHISHTQSQQKIATLLVFHMKKQPLINETSKMWPMATVVSSKRNMSIPSPWLGVCVLFFRMVGMWRTKVELEGWGSWIPSYPEPAKNPKKEKHMTRFFFAIWGARK